MMWSLNYLLTFCWPSDVRKYVGYERMKTLIWTDKCEIRNSSWEKWSSSTSNVSANVAQSFCIRVEGWSFNVAAGACEDVGGWDTWSQHLLDERCLLESASSAESATAAVRQMSAVPIWSVETEGEIGRVTRLYRIEEVSTFKFGVVKLTVFFY